MLCKIYKRKKKKNDHSVNQEKLGKGISVLLFAFNDYNLPTTKCKSKTKTRQAENTALYASQQTYKKLKTTQSPGAVEYTNCISAEG